MVPLAFGDKLVIDAGIGKYEQPFLAVVGILGRKVALGGIVDLLVGKTFVGEHGVELLLVRSETYAAMHVDRRVGPHLLHIAFAGELEHATKQHQGPGRDAGKNTHILLAADIGHDLDLLVPFWEQGGVEIRRKERTTYPGKVMKHDSGNIAIADIRMRCPGDAAGHDQVFVGKYPDVRITLV